MLQHVIRAATVVAIALATSMDVQAQAKVQVGTLTCVGGEGIGLVVGSEKAYHCRFVPTGGQWTEVYRATVKDRS